MEDRDFGKNLLISLRFWNNYLKKKLLFRILDKFVHQRCNRF